MRRIVDRLDEYMSFKGLNDNKVTVNCGLSVGLIGRARKGKSDIGKKSIEKILNFYQDLNRVWLLTGDGNMLKSNIRNMSDVYSASQKDDDVVMVDFVPVSARASFLENLDTSSYSLEKFPIIPKSAEKTEIDKYKIFEVDGDSMHPTISDGALILAKIVPESSWHYAEGVVVAVFSDFVVVKRIARNELLTSNTLVLASDNEKYGQMTVQLADIRAIYKAKRIISSDIR